MNAYFIKTPSLIKLIFNKWVWSFSKKEKSIYLTFDDGPTEEITDWTLKILYKYNAKATFFCIGKNINAHTNLFQKILLQGHSVGNHTNNHLNCSKSTLKEYLQDIEAAETYFNKESSKLFRPPYGKLRLKQCKKIREKGYKIIMWDVLSADFDTTISPKKCLENVIKNSQNGSIITFHDSIKASKNLKYVLPKVLEYYSAKGFLFKGIE